MPHSFLILGSGMAGMGAAARLRERGASAHVLEKKAYPGGHTATHCRDGFVFDEGPHVSFTKMDKVKSIFAETLRISVRELGMIDATCIGRWRNRLKKIALMNGVPRN